MNIRKINSIINVSYIFTPIYFLFISAKLESYKFEYVIISISLIVSLIVNLKEKIRVKKIGLILFGYLIIHICRDLIFNDFFYSQIYKKITINGILAVYFFSLPFNYSYLKKLLYKGSVYYFYIFYFQFYIFYKEYLTYLTYMTIGLNLMLPTCIFLFSFFLNRKRQKRDMIYGGILFLTILKCGNRSPLLIISIIIFYVLLLRKDVFSKKRKTILIMIMGIFLLNLAKIVNLLSHISFFKDARIIIKLKQYYENIGTGLLSGRDIIIRDYIQKINENFIFGNLIASNQINQGSYSHNIIIDLLYHNGVILGLIIIIVISILILKAKKDVLLLSFLSMFLVLIFSSYYLLNRNFYIVIIIAFSLLCNKKETDKI